MISWWWLLVAFVGGFTTAIGFVWWLLSDESAMAPRNWR